MGQLFDIDRTVRTWGLYLDGHADVLDALLRSVARTLDRLLPPSVSSRIDREGSSLERADGRLVVRRHPALAAALAELARLDLFRVFLSRRHGGLELPVGIYTLLVQLIARYDASLALAFLVHGNAMYVIHRYGTEEQRQRYLPELAAGTRLATVAFSEPQAGSDAGAIRTRATREGGGYVLSGSKLWITHGGDADLLVTTARTGPLASGIAGVSTFLVEREADGVETVGLEEKTGLSGSPTAELAYADLRIPADRLLGAEGQGGSVMFAGVGMTRVNIGALALGIAKRAFDAAVEFALQREQGGRLIVEHDAIRQRLADMVLTISATENMICDVARLEEQRVWHVREMSITKYFASEALQELTMRAINVLGGYGVSRHHLVERCRREAAALPLFGGTSEIQWLIIARELLQCVGGRAHVDYMARDAARATALAARCAGTALAPLARRLEPARDALWRATSTVSAEADPSPYYRHLAELAVSLTVAEVLLWQASAPAAEELERELAAVATDRLEERAASTARVVDGRITGAALKRAVRERL